MITYILGALLAKLLYVHTYVLCVVVRSTLHEIFKTCQVELIVVAMLLLVLHIVHSAIF